MNTQLKAVIFDVDGTIADTEQYGHLPAANEAMQKMGLNIQWNWAEFRVWINTIPGNVNRLKYSLSKRNISDSELDKITTTFASLKKKIYIDKYLPKISLRKGILSLIQEAVSNDIRLAIVSTSYESQIRALLQAQLPSFYSLFEPILGKESGVKTDNGGYLHKKCVAEMNLNPEEIIVIEDAQNGLEAANLAGLNTAIFYNDYTYGSCFQHAKLVAPSAHLFSLRDISNICLRSY